MLNWRGLWLVLRNGLACIGIEDQEISLIALIILAEIEHLRDGVGDCVKRALDALAAEPAVR